MKEIFLEAGGLSHPIYIKEGLLKRSGEALKMAGLSSPVILVTNTTVGPLYSKTVIDNIRESGYHCTEIEIPDGEKFKTLKTAELLYDRFLEEGMDRSGTVIGLGGGWRRNFSVFRFGIFFLALKFLQYSI